MRASLTQMGSLGTFGCAHLVRKRGQLLEHIQNTRHQYQLPEFERRIAYPANRDGLTERFKLQVGAPEVRANPLGVE